MIHSIINIDRTTYTSNLDLEKLRVKLVNAFQPKKSSINGFLSGEFITDKKFKASSSWTSSWYSIRNYEKDPAYIYGKISVEKGNTIIRVSYRPNSIFIIFSFLFALFGLILFAGLLKWNPLTNTFLGIWFLIWGPLLYLWGRFHRLRLKKRFERFLAFNYE